MDLFSPEVEDPLGSPSMSGDLSAISEDKEKELADDVFTSPAEKPPVFKVCEEKKLMLLAKV